MLERDIEKRLREVVERAGGECWKWKGILGAPDRVLFLPGGRVLFVECKAPKETPRPSQLRIHRRLQKLGIKVIVLDRLIESVEDLL
jgi:hypothetical protein